jgi:hypothetical protein
MRLGKEQAVGYVEDTGASDTGTDSLPADQLTVSRSGELPLTATPDPLPAPESPLTVN